jgi:hypothetical protein
MRDTDYTEIPFHTEGILRVHPDAGETLCVAIPGSDFEFLLQLEQLPNRDRVDPL